MTEKPTDPSPIPDSLLPDADPDAAPDLVLHLPGNPVPVIDVHEISTLAPAESDYMPPATNGDVLSGVRNLLKDHEKHERAIADTVAERVEKIEQSAQAERQAMAERVEIVVSMLNELPTHIKVAAAETADKFLGRIDRLISEFADVRETLLRHDLRITELERANKEKAP